MLRKFVHAVILVGLLSGGAYAQNGSLGIPLKPDIPPTQEEIEQKKATDRDYQAAVRKIPDKKQSSDPWGTIRPASPTASKAKQPQQ